MLHALRLTALLTALVVAPLLASCEPQQSAETRTAESSPETNRSPSASGLSLHAPVLPERPKDGAFNPPSPEGDKIWQQHLDALSDQPIQEACKPYRIQAQGQHRGSVVLYHGFTACPQQYWEVGPMLAKAGYDVYVPLLPGHGRNYRQEKGKTVDDFSVLPADGQYIQYRELAETMTDMIQADAGEHLVMGLSLGGVIAAEALIQDPEFYDRALLMTPLFDVVAEKKPYLPSANLLVPKHLVDWGPECEYERQNGRGGICKFQIRHVRAAQRLGSEALAKINSVAKTKIQLVGVKADHAANNEALAKAASRLQQGSTCLYQTGVNHSLLSRHDSPQDKKFWLEQLQAQILRFTETGEFFDAVEPTIELGLKRCHIP